MEEIEKLETSWDLSRKEWEKKFGKDEDQGHFPNAADQDVWADGFVVGYELYQAAMKSMGVGFVEVNSKNHEIIAGLQDELKFQQNAVGKLYSLVHEDVMKARIKIYKLGDKHEIDNVMSDLSMNAPMNAIDLFKK